MDLPMMGAALVVGLLIGYVIALLTRPKPAAPVAPVTPSHNWWEERHALTGTQLQILQHMEAKREDTITSLQEKFSFIPDRELYYRLEQICLMGFVERRREEGEMHYSLNKDYGGTVEEDKTVILS